MTFEGLLEKIRKVQYELNSSGLDVRGYGVEIELSIASFRDLVSKNKFSLIRTEVDTPIERVHRGTVFGVPFVITQDTDRVLIAKEIKENE